MGVITSLFVGPSKEFSVSYEVYENLIKDFISLGYLNPRSAILEGELNPSVLPFVSFRNPPLDLPHRNKNIICRFRGDDMEECTRAIRSLPFGKVNLCVYFDGFNWNNKELRESFENFGFGNASIAFYAFASPQKIYTFNAYEGKETWREYVFTHYFTCEAKSAPHTIKKTVLEPLFIRHFGSDFVEDCSFT